MKLIVLLTCYTMLFSCNTFAAHPKGPSGPGFVTRGQVWVNKHVIYSQHLSADVNGITYDPKKKGGSNKGWRQDCSGLVSMAWGLPELGVIYTPNTTTLPNWSTSVGSDSELQPGDAINNRKWGNYGHVILFAGWKDRSKKTFWALEERGHKGAIRTLQQLVYKGNGKWDVPTIPNHAPWYIERYNKVKAEAAYRKLLQKWQKELREFKKIPKAS